jgi:hypothetical protein
VIEDRPACDKAFGVAILREKPQDIPFKKRLAAQFIRPHESHSSTIRR